MALNKLPYRWEFKPPLGTEPDLDSSLARGLVDLLIFNEGAGAPRNLAAPYAVPATFGAIQWLSATAGTGMLLDGSGALSLPNHANYAAGDFSVRVVFLPQAWNGTVAALFDKGTSSSARELSFFFDASGNISFATIGGINSSISLPTGCATGSVWDLVLTRIGSTCTAYVNGAAKGTFTNAGTTGTPTAPLWMGASSTGGTVGSLIYFQFATWSRGLSDSEIMELYEQPYAIWQPPTIKRWFVSTATAPPPTTIALTIAIASAESFGAVGISSSDSINPPAIGSTESFGATNIVFGTSLAPAPIVSGESFGTAGLASAVGLAPGAIGSTESFGVANIVFGTSIAPAAIASSESFGTLALDSQATIVAPAIATGERWATIALDIAGLFKPRRDDYVLNDIYNRLVATGAWDQIVNGANPEQVEIAADRANVAWLMRDHWREQDTASPRQAVRVMPFRLVVAVRHEDPEQAFATLCRLEAIAQQAINGQKLADFCMPVFSLIDAGQIDPRCAHPEYRIIMTGSARYLLADSYATGE